MVNAKTFFLTLLAIFLGTVAAMLVWTLIVKNQIATQLATAQAANPLLSAIGGI